MSATIEAYIATFPPEVQVVLSKIRAVIADAAPGAQEKISYQIPTFALHGNLVHFAAFKKHIGFYPAPSAIAAFKDDLVGFATAKGSVQFPLDRPIPYDLIARMVTFRVREQSKNSGG